MPYPIPLPEPPPMIIVGSAPQLSAPAIASPSEPVSPEGKDLPLQSPPGDSPLPLAAPKSGITSPLPSPSLLAPANMAPGGSQMVLTTTDLTAPQPTNSVATLPVELEVSTTPPSRPSVPDPVNPLAALSPDEASTAAPQDTASPHRRSAAALRAALAAPRPAPPRPVSSQPSALTPALSASVLAQNSSPTPPVDPTPADPSVDSSPPAARDPAVIIYPQGATPEPFWSNGGVTSDGQLLPPTQPTSRPDTPLDLTADSQTYEPLQQIVTAQGNVVLRLGNGILVADRLWANLFNRYVLVEGNVIFQQGDQTIRGQRGEYNLIQGQGRLFDASGTLFLPTLEDDLAAIVPEEPVPNARPISELLRQDPLGNVQSTGGVTFGLGGDQALDNATGDSVRRIRFEAAQVDFDAEGWIARDVRLTNDPFSPPELEIRGDTARLVRINETLDELFIENGRIVFDQAFSVPLFRSRYLLQRGETDEVTPLITSIGFDGEDRDGLFIERTVGVLLAPPWELQVTPQLLLQRLIEDSDFDFSVFGLEVDLTGQLGPRTRVEANASFSGLDLIGNVDDRLRASVRVRQALGTHSLNLEYSFRDRLFNGSLGFQDVQSSVGAVLLSPNIVLGKTGVVLTYQASAQFVTAETDQFDLLDDPFDPDRLVGLGRFQGSVSLGRGFVLWQGDALPPTRDEGLRFTPRPVVPNLVFFLGGRGTYTYYTSLDTQAILSAVVGIRGELGHFSRNFFDSTIFNLSYQRSLSIGDGESPFLFDRDVDQNVLSGGIIQQIYGPFRLGAQVAVNLDTGEFIDTDYILEYSRRTYGLVIRFNPIKSSGFIGFRLSDFDWSGRAAQFGGADIRQVDGGVVR